MHLHTTLIGHIGRDAETRSLQGGRVVTSFTVAHTESWKDSRGEKQERTTWVNCSYFTVETPGVKPYLLKGAIVCVTGKVSARAYLDARNEPAASLDLNVQEIRLLGGSKKRKEEAQPGNVPPTTAKQPAPFTTTPDDIAGDNDLPF